MPYLTEALLLHHINYRFISFLLSIYELSQYYIKYIFLNDIKLVYLRLNLMLIFHTVRSVKIDNRMAQF